MKKTSNKSSPRVYAGATAAARKAARQQALIEAAYTLIGENGYKALTVRSVCTETGLTNRYFYESFDSAEDLLIAVYRSTSLELLEELERAYYETGNELRARLDAIALAYFNFVKDPRRLRILTAEVLGVSEEVTDCYMQGVSNFAELFHRIALDGGKKTKENEQSVALFGQMLVGSATFAAVAWCESGYKKSVSEVSRVTSQTLFAAIVQFYSY